MSSKLQSVAELQSLEFSFFVLSVVSLCRYFD